jgi:hypothetical protein
MHFSCKVRPSPIRNTLFSSWLNRQLEHQENQTWLEPNLNARLIAEVTLVLVSGGKSVPKPRKYVIGLHRPKGNGAGEWDVDPSTDYEVECIVAWIVDDACKRLTQVAVETGMGSAKQDFAEWFEVPRPELNDWPHAIREEIGRRTGGNRTAGKRD